MHVFIHRWQSCQPQAAVSAESAAAPPNTSEAAKSMREGRTRVAFHEAGDQGNAAQHFHGDILLFIITSYQIYLSWGACTYLFIDGNPFSLGSNTETKHSGSSSNWVQTRGAGSSQVQVHSNTHMSQVCETTLCPSPDSGPRSRPKSRYSPYE